VVVQFNVLWESLSAREHLNVFGSLKGLSGADLIHVGNIQLQNLALYKSGNFGSSLKSTQFSLTADLKCKKICIFLLQVGICLGSMEY
jgi:hypothetical protein